MTYITGSLILLQLKELKECARRLSELPDTEYNLICNQFEKQIIEHVHMSKEAYRSDEEFTPINAQPANKNVVDSGIISDIHNEYLYSVLENHTVDSKQCLVSFEKAAGYCGALENPKWIKFRCCDMTAQKSESCLQSASHDHWHMCANSVVHNNFLSPVNKHWILAENENANTYKELSLSVKNAEVIQNNNQCYDEAYLVDTEDDEEMIKHDVCAYTGTCTKNLAGFCTNGQATLCQRKLHRIDASTCTYMPMNKQQPGDGTGQTTYHECQSGAFPQEHDKLYLFQQTLNCACTYESEKQEPIKCRPNTVILSDIPKSLQRIESQPEEVSECHKELTKGNC